MLMIWQWLAFLKYFTVKLKRRFSLPTLRYIACHDHQTPHIQRTQNPPEKLRPTVFLCIFKKINWFYLHFHSSRWAAQTQVRPFHIHSTFLNRYPGTETFHCYRSVCTALVTIDFPVSSEKELLPNRPKFGGCWEVGRTVGLPILTSFSLRDLSHCWCGLYCSWSLQMQKVVNPAQSSNWPKNPGLPDSCISVQTWCKIIDMNSCRLFWWKNVPFLLNSIKKSSKYRLIYWSAFFHLSIWWFKQLQWNAVWGAEHSSMNITLTVVFRSCQLRNLHG